jgi:6-pyruvoyltetrahydropterin/6-carboxytetrahydropterin synthase
MRYRSTKTYGHELGLSACYRQWRAESHCRFLHGYPLSFRFEFGAWELNEKGWVVDFGALGPLKEKLVETFDHKLLVAGDDPWLRELTKLHSKPLQIADVLVLPFGVGCERFAKLAFGFAQDVILRLEEPGRVKVICCECREHGSNSAIYYHEGIR